jgi:hypothetical protein
MVLMTRDVDAILSNVQGLVVKYVGMIVVWVAEYDSTTQQTQQTQQTQKENTNKHYL